MQRSEIKTNDTVKDIVAEEGTGLPGEQIIVEKIYLIANKCDDGQTFDSENDLYQLGFGDPIYIAAESGEGMHELWKVIDESVPAESLQWFKERAKKRVARYKALRDQLREELEAQIK